MPPASTSPGLPVNPATSAATPAWNAPSSTHRMTVTTTRSAPMSSPNTSSLMTCAANISTPITSSHSATPAARPMKMACRVTGCARYASIRPESSSDAVCPFMSSTPATASMSGTSTA